jgi:HAE1 family hydrophobic/amphiphilic exporter-1
VVLRWQFLTLMVFIATLVGHGLPVRDHPKGFFPQQDTGLISASIRGGAGHLLVREHERAHAELAEIVRKRDPDVAGFGMNGSSSTYNTGNFFISLKPKDEGRTATPPTRSSRGCARSWRRCRA